MKNFFDDKGIRIVQLTHWLDWVIDQQTTSDKWMVVLPMIQRGSVWKPHQVIDLWDTILRGMPFGGLMASYIPAKSDTQFFHPITRKLITPEDGGISLIDGQQRTLSMLVAWPGVEKQMNRRIWVDLGEDDNNDHLLQFYLTTESQPFGFQKGGESGASIAKLPLSERRLAAAAYASCETKPLLHADGITPWKSIFALDLCHIIKEFNEEKNLSGCISNKKSKAIENLNGIISFVDEKDSYNSDLKNSIKRHLNNRLLKIRHLGSLDGASALNKRIKTLQEGLGKIFKQHFPVIEVPGGMISAEAENDKQDPPLAVLFKRIGTGGTDLTTPDYVFSVIKHLNSECHRLVEEQLSNDKISAIYSPTNLVMSAVRLTAAKLGGTDYARFEKPREFNKLIRGIEKEKDKNEKSFLPEFNSQISSNGNFVENLGKLLGEISYHGSGDIGFPKHALCLVKITVLEVILYWMQQKTTQFDLKKNRLPIIRFILCWNLTVSDSLTASKSCFKFLKEKEYGIDFPEESLVKKLIEEELALPMRSPDDLKEIPTLPIRRKNKSPISTTLVHSPEDVTGLRGWRRFIANIDGVDDETRIKRQKAVKLYERWWNLQGGYSHLFLLWLQRDYVSSKFEKQAALPGQGEDTPYDFDHICPQNHWYHHADTTKFHAEDISGLDNQGHWRLGHAIGNVRIWDSSENRSDGDSVPSVKLNTTDTLKDSCIEEGERNSWSGCNLIKNSKNPKKWDLNRAKAFQKAIELRTFNLYKKFCLDLELFPATQSIASNAQAPSTQQ